MSNAIAARKEGDFYQGMVFWNYANDMLHEDSDIESILYEDTEIKAFDDIVINYKKKVKFRDHEVAKDHIQVKFHMRQTACFTVDHLLDPKFINAKEKSFMDNVVSAYRQLGEDFKERRFILYSVWDIDQRDELYQIINNTEQSFAIDKMFDGTTSRSAMGRIRQKFYDKLNVTEQELKEILTQVCIYSGQEKKKPIIQSVNEKLCRNGLKVIPESQVTNPYFNMLEGWMQGGRKKFDRAFLMAACKEEGLTVSRNQPSTIVIRSYPPQGDKEEGNVSSCLDLVDCFEERFLKADHSWDEIYRRIAHYVGKQLTKGREYLIGLPTHYTIALMAGRILNSKSGIKTTVIQNTLEGEAIWKIDQSGESAYPELKVEIKEIDKNHSDSAIVIGITREIQRDVEAYLEEEKILIGNMYHCTLEKTGNLVIIDGKHAWQITEQINSLIGKRSPKEKRGTLHLFYAGPVSIIYNLGKLSLAYGEMQIYEHDIHRRRGTYYPTCKLPMDEEI